MRLMTNLRKNALQKTFSKKNDDFADEDDDFQDDFKIKEARKTQDTCTKSIRFRSVPEQLKTQPVTSK